MLSFVDRSEPFGSPLGAYVPLAPLPLDAVGRLPFEGMRYCEVLHYRVDRRLPVSRADPRPESDDPVWSTDVPETRDSYAPSVGEGSPMEKQSPVFPKHRFIQAPETGSDSTASDPRQMKYLRVDVLAEWRVRSKGKQA